MTAATASYQRQATIDDQQSAPTGEQFAMDTFPCRKPTERNGGRPPWHRGFTERVNRVESRANTVRPLGQSLRRYLVAISVVELSLGLWALWPRLMPFLFAPQERFTDVGTLVLGVAFLILGAMSLSLYLLDIVRGLMLARMDTRQLKRRLAKATPSGKYIASSQHLRGAKVGAWFFGLSTLVVFAALVVRMLAGGIPH